MKLSTGTDAYVKTNPAMYPSRKAALAAQSVVPAKDEPKHIDVSSQQLLRNQPEQDKPKKLGIFRKK
jgi:hypothetical protein